MRSNILIDLKLSGYLRQRQQSYGATHHNDFMLLKRTHFGDIDTRALTRLNSKDRQMTLPSFYKGRLARPLSPKGSGDAMDILTAATQRDIAKPLPYKIGSLRLLR
jgi:hypothetical protein